MRQGDSQWAGHRQVGAVYAMINAEELGVTSENVDDMRANSDRCECSPYAWRVEGNLHEGLGLTKDWAYDVIKQVGNYGENYEAYMGGGKLGIGIASRRLGERAVDQGRPDVFSADALDATWVQ